MSPAGQDASFLDEAGFDPFGRDPEIQERLRPLLEALLDRYFHLAVDGAENIPGTGRALLVANHGGALPWDALVLTAALARGGDRGGAGRAVRALVEDPVMTAPFLGTLMTRLGCVRASQDNATRLLERDESVAVFPEGMLGLGKLYRQRHRLQRFGRGGFVRLALRTRAPILPVAIVGAEETAPLLARLEVFFRSHGGKGSGLPYLPITPLFPLLGPLGLLPLPARWRIRVGTPIFVHEELPDADDIAVGEVAARVRELVQAQVNALVALRGKQVWL